MDVRKRTTGVTKLALAANACRKNLPKKIYKKKVFKKRRDTIESGKKEEKKLP